MFHFDDERKLLLHHGFGRVVRQINAIKAGVRTWQHIELIIGCAIDAKGIIFAQSPLKSTESAWWNPLASGYELEHLLALLVAEFGDDSPPPTHELAVAADAATVVGVPPPLWHVNVGVARNHLRQFMWGKRRNELFWNHVKKAAE